MGNLPDPRLPGGLPPGLTELAMMAAQLHELYSAWVEAGFTEDQAMQMICTVLSTGMQGGTQ